MAVNITAPYANLQEQEQQIARTYDPFQKTLYNTLLANTFQGGKVPAGTVERIQQLIQQPGLPATGFEQIAQPLAESLVPQERREQGQLQDLFRRAGVGSQQSGAFAQAGRQLIGDQASRRNQLLAANYVPLTESLNKSQYSAIAAALGLPGAVAEGLKPATALATSLGGPTQQQGRTTTGTGFTYQPTGGSTPNPTYYQPFSKFDYSSL